MGEMVLEKIIIGGNQTSGFVTVRVDGEYYCELDKLRAEHLKKIFNFFEQHDYDEVARNLAKGRALYKDMVDLQICLANILGKYEGTHQSNDEPRDE